MKWVARQLGHNSPELTLRVYAHVLREEDEDLSFLDFGGTQTAPAPRRTMFIEVRPLLVVGI